MTEVKATSIDELLRELLAGKDPGAGGGQLRIEEQWPERLAQLLDAATQTGDHARASRIAPLAALLRYSASAQRDQGDRKGEVGRILTLARNSGSESLHSWVVGQLGSAVGWPDGVKCLEEAWNIAHAAGLDWAKCQWAANLANLWAQHDPEEAARWAGNSLEMARSIGDMGRVGIALNALAIISGMRPDSLVQARNYAVEALAIAKGAGDKRRVAERSAHLAELCEKLGLREEAISLFSKALDGFRELKHPKTLDLIRYLAALITAPFEDAARPILSSHVRKLDRSLGKSDISQLLQQTRKGQVMMANWDPTHQTTVFEPDLDFARDLCERGEWRALAVYARQWTEQSFLAGDSTGLYWLSISFRRLGFKDAADAALEFGLRLHGFFEGRLDPRNAEA